MKIAVFLRGNISVKLLLIAILLPALCSAQKKITGTVSDAATNKALSDVNIRIGDSNVNITTDSKGKFEIILKDESEIRIHLSHISYESQQLSINPDMSEVNVRMKIRSYISEEVTISATRNKKHSAFAHDNISSEELQRSNFGQDMPYLLQMTPSLVTTSDAGSGIGYTGMRIRGSDATRVNVTLNGVPVNDAESHQVYWVDLPDLASSVDNIQIQRGVGTSSNGAGAFGASVNILTSKVSPLPYGSIQSSAGSFNTFRNSVGFGSGLLSNRFAIEGRMSKITSDGYIDRASSDLKSFYLSGGYYGSKNSLRAVILSGKEKTYQAWYGVPEDSLKTNRTFNPAGLYFNKDGEMKYYDNQVDNYQQDYYQLHYTHSFSNEFSFNSTLHYTRGNGYYEEYQDEDMLSNYGIADVIRGNDTVQYSDFIRQRWLDNDFFGLTLNGNYQSDNFDVHASFSAHQYLGDHFGELIWSEQGVIGTPPQRYYFNDAEKNDMSGYLKFIYRGIENTEILLDLQIRRIDYSFSAPSVSGEMINQESNMTFYNPRLGITYMLSPGKSVYASIAMAGKEPVRDDFINSSPASRPGSEKLTDYEAGIRYQRSNLNLNLNLYFMKYKDQLILTGKINDVGEYTRQNVDNSYRSGAEIQVTWQIRSNLALQANASFSRNKIDLFEEFIDDYDEGIQRTIIHKNTDIAFSPSIISSAMLSWAPVKKVSLDLIGRHVGEQFLDNTNNKNRMLEAYFTSDFRFRYTLNPKWMKELALSCSVNNLFDKLYSSNAYTFSYLYGGQLSTFNYFYPQAGRHVFAGVSFKF
ncbi:MAG: TonB-dependent receptor [Bacteroidetes bacterium]|nr:MAG: TonB-dependent receptor [Bacteroidota bacterium]REK00363.1 MAG: TonB-dependent receptor [Bacteroidota bacterium]REK35482.1 MAG: TonB-dependent receptor [Bacteroidota bacterium]REK46834.1 MAG: TonB-dependent receptor [Bacteroidota bacterium]